jgi:hypothetical protein
MTFLLFGAISLGSVFTLLLAGVPPIRAPDAPPIPAGAVLADVLGGTPRRLPPPSLLVDKGGTPRRLRSEDVGFTGA